LEVGVWSLIFIQLTKGGFVMFTTLNQSKKELSIAQLTSFYKRGVIKLDIEAQRGYVWDLKRKSNLIQSILSDMPINMFYYSSVEVGRGERTVEVLRCIDGKQRDVAILEYRAGLYKLHYNTKPIVDEDGNVVDISKRSFVDLPKNIQDKFLAYTMMTYVYKNLSLEDEIELFVRVNSGKPVTAADIIRTKIKSRAAFIELAKHPVIESVLVKKRKDKLEDEDIMADVWCMGYTGEPCLLRNKTSALLFEEATQEQIDKISEALDYMHELVTASEKDKKLMRKFHMKSHLTMAIYMALVAVRNGVSSEIFVSKAQEFYTTNDRTGSVDGDYNKATQTGSSKPEQVRTRMDAVEKHLG
jgi:hypothetical protein